MTGWSVEHARQVQAAYDVLRQVPASTARAQWLYAQWYAARSPVSGAAPEFSAPVSGVARAAHARSSSWAKGDAAVVGTGVAGVVVIETEAGRRALCRGEYVTTVGRPGFAPRLGDRVRPIIRTGAIEQDGWFRTWGSGWNPRGVNSDLVRVYLRPRRAASARLVHALTEALTGASVGQDRWLLKLAAASVDLTRPDACVVYLRGPDRGESRALVVAAASGLTTGAPPPLTQRCADGVGWAEDPGTGESFGEVRCAALAAAYGSLDEAASESARRRDWLDAAASEMRMRGIDPAAPHRSSTVEVNQ